MPFIPHTPEDERKILAAIGVADIDTLFDEIPPNLLCGGLNEVPTADSEMEISRRMHRIADKNDSLLCFAGAGAYEHHIPAAVWEVTTRGEYYSAYTPYQAEASQGTLQLLYEFQTMMARLTGMDVSNASLYDGASALAEAILMSVRGNRKSKSKRVLVPGAVNPVYREVAHNIVKNQQIDLQEVAFDAATGQTATAALDAYAGEDICAVVIQQPNYFGVLEDVHAMVDWAHAQGALVIAVVNPTSLGMLTPPGSWGETGADIVCGEGQPLGIPLSGGGPYFGFMCSTQALVRQLPGRIIGRTVDMDGKQGFALTLQAREQHIRRSKATSNICTNQGLMVTAATIYMSITGGVGLHNVAAKSHENNQALLEKLTAVTGVSRVFTGTTFHETVIKLNKPVAEVLEALAQQGVLGGVSAVQDYPELGEALVVCTTETATTQDIDDYVAAMTLIMGDAA